MKFSSIAVITGVSTGIGYETARTLAGRGFHVFGSVRRAFDADRLKAELGDQFTPLQFDLRDPQAIRAACSQPDSSIGRWPSNLDWRRTVNKSIASLAVAATPARPA
jgi:hypothetical protein